MYIIIEEKQNSLIQDSNETPNRIERSIDRKGSKIDPVERNLHV